jgi:toxin ParE1/3/4
MTVRFTETALIEIDEIFAYIARNNPTAAAGVVQRIQQMIARLGEFPRMAPKTDEAGARMAPLGRYPYLIFYAIEGDDVVVLHVRHGARLRPGEAGIE